MTQPALHVHGRRPIHRNPLRLASVLIGGGCSAALILLPFYAVFRFALRDGWTAYLGYLVEPSTLHSIKLSLTTVAITVPVCTAFGICAAWAIAKFDFPGRKLLISLIELPLSISPIVIGAAYLFVFGREGLLGPWLLTYDLRLVFNATAIVLVTIMVTLPYIFREVLPLMQIQGNDEEQVAITLGAGPLTTFWRVTLPNIKWALLYGITLCLARGLGEYGSVAVVSGAIRNRTNTMPLQIDLLFNDFVQTGAFAVASILTSVAVVTLLVKIGVEAASRRQQKTAAHFTGVPSPRDRDLLLPGEGI
ncbi:MAG TPA: sulfate ABC transporter permease subunit [Kiritimatiellia bacterium]|nr:sulfate ABC transporter permease subunit [Kiritimatiellia bacterium]